VNRARLLIRCRTGTASAATPAMMDGPSPLSGRPSPSRRPLRGSWGPRPARGGAGDRRVLHGWSSAGRSRSRWASRAASSSAGVSVPGALTASSMRPSATASSSRASRALSRPGHRKGCWPEPQAVSATPVPPLAASAWHRMRYGYPLFHTHARPQLYSGWPADSFSASTGPCTGVTLPCPGPV